MPNKFKLAGLILCSTVPVMVYGGYKFVTVFVAASISYKMMLTIGLLSVVFSEFPLYFGRMVYVLFPKLLLQYLYLKPNDPHLFLKDHIYKGIVAPSDLDPFFHMNNARYGRECDFARLAFFFDTGLNKIFIKNSVYMVMTSQTTRFRRSLTLFQQFAVKTKVAYWDNEAFYIEHRFISQHKDFKDFVYCIILTKMNVINSTPQDLLGIILATKNIPESPPLSDEVKLFIKYNTTSSQALKIEYK